MVNLAKLRKKTKDKKEKAAEELPVVEAPPPPPQPPARAVPETDKIAAYLAGAGSSRAEVQRSEEVVQTGDQIELLTFVIAGEQYAIDIENVVEIVTPRPATKIPNANSSVVGILSLRGTIVILVDARGSLGHPAAEAAPGPDARIVVVQHDSENLGFMVDRVLRVVKIDPDEIQPHPVVHSSEHDESVRGVFRQDAALTIVLDFSKLIFNRNEWN